MRHLVRYFNRNLTYKPSFFRLFYVKRLLNLAFFVHMPLIIYFSQGIHNLFVGYSGFFLFGMAKQASDRSGAWLGTARFMLL